MSLVVAAAKTAWAWLGTAGLAQTIVKGAISFGLSTIVQKQLARNPGFDDFASEAGRRLTTTRAANEPRRIVYGKMRIGGHFTYFETHGEDNKYLNAIITLTGHEVEAIDSIYWGDTTLTFSGSDGNATNSDLQYPGLNTPLIFASKNLGADSQAADGDLTGLGISWDANNRQRGCANIYLRLHGHQELVNDLKNVTCLVRGKNDIYDPRDLSTGYSTNAALCVANFLMDTRYGFGVPLADIDEDSLIAAANVCDESVTLADASTESRYTINGTFRADQPRGKILQDMVSAMAGEVCYVGGKYYIHAGAYTAPTVTLTDDHLRSGLQIKVLDSVSEAVNRVRGIYANPQADYQVDDFPAVTNATYLSEDNGEEHWRDLELPFTTSYATAQRLAKIELERSRQEITVQFPAMLHGIQVQAGDTVAITNTRMGWSSKVFDVLEVTLVDDNGYLGTDLLLKETASTVYTWANGEETTVDPAPNTTLPDPNTVPAPTGLTVTSGTDELVLKSDGSIVSRAHLNWTSPASEFAGRIEVEWKPSIESGNGTINATDNTLTDVSEPFREHMVGKSITVEGAGVAGADLTTTIASFTSKSSVELADAASTTVSLNAISGPCFYKKLAPLPADTTDWWIPDLVDGTDYDFRIRSQSVLGRYSSYDEVTGHTLVGKTAAPGIPTGLTLTASTESIFVQVTAPSDADIYTVQIQWDTEDDFGGEPFSTALLAVPGETVSYTIRKYKSGGSLVKLESGILIYVRAISVDTTGNTSSYTTAASVRTRGQILDIPDFSAHGKVGGSGDIRFELNKNIAGGSAPGSVRILGSRYIDTDGTVYPVYGPTRADSPMRSGSMYPDQTLDFDGSELDCPDGTMFIAHINADAHAIWPLADIGGTEDETFFVVLEYYKHGPGYAAAWIMRDANGDVWSLAGTAYDPHIIAKIEREPGAAGLTKIVPYYTQLEKPLELELEYDTLADLKAETAAKVATIPAGAKVRWKGKADAEDGCGGEGIWSASNTDTADDLKVIKFTNVTTGRVLQRFTQPIHSRLIAAGDNSSNDGPELQAAIDAAIADGTALRITAGLYVTATELVINGSLTLIFDRGAILRTSANNAINLIKITAGNVTIVDAELNHNHTQSGSTSSVSPIKITGGDRVRIIRPNIYNADYGAITVADLTSDITALYITEATLFNVYGGIFVNNGAGTYDIDLIQISQPIIYETQTEAIDINSGPGMVQIDNPIIRRPYVSADLGTGGNPENLEAIDIEDCQNVIINNPMIDGADIDGNNAACPTGIRIKGTTTENIQVNGGIIRNLAKPANNTTLHDADATNWTTSGSCSGSGSTLTWTGTGDAQDTVTAQGNMTYLIKLTVSGMTTGSLVVAYGGTTAGTITEAGDYMFYVNPGGSPTNTLLLDGQSGFDGAVDLAEFYMCEHWGAGVILSRTPRAGIRGALIENVANGISIIQQGSGNCTNAIIDGCTIKDYLFTGIGQWETDLTDFRIANNLLASSDKVSDIELKFGTRGTIQGNTINAGPELIHVRDGTKVVVMHNHCLSGNSAAAILIGSLTDADSYAHDNHGVHQSWDGSHIVWPESTNQHLWRDSTGDVRKSNGKPTSDTAGTVVGTQT